MEYCAAVKRSGSVYSHDLWNILLNEKNKMCNSVSSILVLSEEGKYSYLYVWNINQTLGKLVIFKEKGVE